MNFIVLFVIGLPILEVFVMIKVGGMLGALNTILLIILTAITGVYCAKLEGLNTMKSGISQVFKNEIPVYEIVSGAALAFAAVLLIFPGFITDFFGFLLIIPFTRKIILNNILSKYFNKKKGNEHQDEFIEGNYQDIDEDKK